MKRFLVAVVAVTAVAAASCDKKEPEPSTYFDRTIAPILTTSCVRTNTGAGCHVADAKGNALGNLDVSTYAGLAKRKDLLADYGPYGQPALLVKNIDPFQVDVRSYDGKITPITTDIKHAGGSILDPSGSAYQVLRRWIQNGATENNTGTPPGAVDQVACSTFIPARADFDLTKDPANPSYASFRDKVIPVITGQKGTPSCAAGNCHGTLANSLYFTCGDPAVPEQVRWNFLAAEEYLAQTAEASELLRRPLAPTQGGAYHEGGVIFQSSSEEGYQALSAWANEHGPPPVVDQSPGFTFFAEKVQPVLVEKGCMMLQCHSASMFHDYRLRGGSGGSFSLSATRKNYELSLAQLSVESEDPNASRIVRKNLFRPEVCPSCDKASGIAHRGGPLLEDFHGKTATLDECTKGNFDYDAGDVSKIPAYCIMAEWLKRERDGAKLAPLSGIVYVKRPAGSVKRAQDYDVYSPGADLRRVDATLAAGKVTPGADHSLTAGCGLAPESADIRRPQVSWDGTKIAFAARSSAEEPLAVYEMNADGSACAKRADIDSTAPSGNGLLIHNFDPVYAPPDASGGPAPRVVFASTRGNLVNDAYDYQGPQRTPADPTKPNANLYVLENGNVRQLTYLLNMEREPSFMTDGRLIMAAEKRAPGFYQVALRRLDLDGGDYHPLYAQRGSIGFPEATSPVGLSDRDFAAIFSLPSSTDGGGALGIFNRSIGIDFHSTAPADYVIDPGVIDPAQLNAPDPAFFLHGLRLPDPSGIYVSPSTLPDGLMLASSGAGGDYDVFVIDTATGAKTKLFGDAGTAEVDAVGVYARFVRSIFRSTLDEPNGHSQVTSGVPQAEVHILDVPVLASLLFQNTPTGRQIDHDVDQLSIYEDMPPPPDVDSFDKGGANVASDAYGKVYVRRRLLGATPLQKDGSLKVRVPGGLPLVLHLPDTKLSKEKGLPRYQREAIVFAPGEVVHQSFREPFFGALCGACHGSVSGQPVDAALNPDFVTQASATLARGATPVPMDKGPGERGAIEGPPATP